MNSNYYTGSRLSAVSFKGSISVFGGTYPATYLMHRVSEEGELLADLSYLKMIPGGETALVSSGCIYAVDSREENEGRSYRLRRFDGMQWTPVIQRRK